MTDQASNFPACCATDWLVNMNLVVSTCVHDVERSHESFVVRVWMSLDNDWMNAGYSLATNKATEDFRLAYV
jgi:hypothetical protein